MLDTLSQVADLGYAGVEFAGLFDHDPEVVRRHLDSINLVACATHVGLDRLLNNFDSCVSEAEALGCRYIVIPYLTEEYRTESGYHEAADQMTEIARRFVDHNLILAYHNHAFEFEPLSDETVRRGIDILMDTPPDLLTFELDVYWIRHGGVSPTAYLSRHLDRSPLIHLKDMLDTSSRKFTEIGEGVLDFTRMLAMMRQRDDVAWYIVEQDSDFAVSSMDSARRSLENLTRLLNQQAPTS